MTTPRARSRTVLAAAALWTLLAACSESPASVPHAATATAAGDAIAAEVPGGRADWRPDPALRCPTGSRIVRTGPAGAVPLTDGLAAAGAPSVRWDGARVLFVAREHEGDPFDVWECAADGSDRRVVVRHGTDCEGAAHLPDGRIVYAAALAEPSPAAGVRAAQALFVAPGDGTPGTRITFGGGVDADPSVLCDGRIVFASWRADGAGGGRFGLFTVHPDGTGLAAFHIDAADSVLPRQAPDLDVEFTSVRGGAAAARIASWDAPMSVVTDAAGPAAPQTLAPRPRPQGHLSTLRDDRPWLTLVCVDARRGTGSDAALAATSVRIRAQGDVLGDVPLAADGSFHVRVPVDVPIVLETIDAAGRAVAAEHAPFWGRRNEVRVCVGCHDDVECAPPNVRPRAVLEDPADLSGAAPRETVR